MKSLTPPILALLAAALMTGCASGPKFNEVRQSLPQVPEGQGRLFVYRTAVFGAAVQPAIRVNGEKVGNAKPKGFTFTDRPPGEYRIETKTEVARHVDVPLAAGQTKYIRLDPTMGVMIGRIVPKLIDNQKAESEIRSCHYMGDAPAETAANP